MLNKKGFTMIELLSIIVVLSVILVIALPKFIDSLNASKEKERDQKYELVINAAKSYSSINNITLGEHISISILCEEKYIECPITNPVTGEKMDGYVYSSIDAQTGSNVYNYVD
jgi:general secretion pathway protein G